MHRRGITVLASAVVALAAAACGSSSSSSSSSGGSSGTGSSASATTQGSSTSSGSGVNALTGEAASAATGDIPDTQAFLTFHNAGGGYSILYPEGWARKGTATNTTLSDKNNVIHVVITHGAPVTPAAVAAEMTKLKRSTPTLTSTAPATLQLKSGPAVKVSYTTRSAPNPVTGKTVLLVVDRYELSHGGKLAIVDLGTAKGVDNVDAYKKIINSFTWR
jgi:hypothetical protein